NNNNNNVEVSADCIYFKDAAGWNTVYCHSWPNGGDGTTWPGTAMESLGNGLYKIKLPDGHTNIVFNAGGDHCKTCDLNAEFGKAYNNSTNQWETISAQKPPRNRRLFPLATVGDTAFGKLTYTNTLSKTAEI
ncbi:MAG: starch-binding protein, partial [Clostridia bacterium]|nr:starch-binding protein [Clostridia bacterium]